MRCDAFQSMQCFLKLFSSKKFTTFLTLLFSRRRYHLDFVLTHMNVSHVHIHTLSPKASNGNKEINACDIFEMSCNVAHIHRPCDFVLSTLQMKKTTNKKDQPDIIFR